MNKKIVVIGDVILDKYDYCINRHNPESSAPCYTVINTEYKPGGAGNVAANLASLGADFVLISVLGDDPESLILREVLEEKNIPHDLILDRERKTIVKERVLSKIDGRYHLRKDIEKKQYITQGHVQEILRKIDDAEIILISDYNKGTISKELIEGIKKLNIPIIVDPKLSHKEFYNDVFLITPNIIECKQLSGIDNAVLGAESLKEELNANIFLTRSKKGVSYFGLNGERFDFPTEAKTVFDVTGAGDTVISTFTHFFARGFEIKESIRLANKAAGIAVAHPGCYQVTEKEILD